MANKIKRYFEDKKAARVKAAKKAARASAIKGVVTTITSAALTIVMPVATSLILEAMSEAATTTAEKPEETKKKTTNKTDDDETTTDEYPIEVKEIKNLYKAAKAVVTDDKKFGELEFIEYDIAGNLQKLKNIVQETIKQETFIDGAVIVAGRITEAADAVRYVHDYATAAAIAKHYDEKF
jgi:hypothetical protein